MLPNRVKLCFNHTDERSNHLTIIFYLLEKKLTSAVKSVAESLGGDVKQTESELLSKLLDTAKTEKNLR